MKLCFGRTKLFIGLCLYIGLTPMALAQNVICPQASYTIDSDADLAGFYEDAKVCSIVTGNVTVSGQFSGNADNDQKVFVYLPLREIRGELTVSQSNVGAVKSVGRAPRPDGSFEGSDNLVFVNRINVEDNPDLNNLTLTGLERPPNHINVANNTSMLLFALTPDSQPPASSTPVTVEGDWSFSDSPLFRIDMGFPTLQINLAGDLVIERTRSRVYNLGDFSGLRSLRDLKIRFGGSGLGVFYSLGDVTYGTDQDGSLQVSVSGGFQDLESARHIDINQGGFSDVSFPQLATVDIFQVFEYTLVDVNIPKVTVADAVTIESQSARIPADPDNGVTSERRLGDRAGSLGRGWGLGRLRSLNSFTLGIPSDAAADDLAALNLRFDNNLVIDDGGSVTMYSARPSFSLRSIRSLPSTMGSLILVGRRTDSDGIDRAQFLDLDAFNSVRGVGGELWLFGLQFSDLTFLSNVRSVGGSLRITNQPGQSTTLPSGPLDGLQNIEVVAGDLELASMNIENCYALLPLVGWGDSPSRVSGSIAMFGNTPASCNFENLDDLRAEAAPGGINIVGLSLAPGGLSVLSSKPVTNSLFPVTEYEAACRKTNVKSAAILPDQPIRLPANVTTPLTLTFEKAGVVDDVSIDLTFKSVDRSELGLAVTAPDFKLSRTLWSGEGPDKKTDWDVTFTPDTAPGLASFVGTDANGDWILTLTPGGTDGLLSTFRINIDSRYQSVISADAVSENFVELPVDDLPAGSAFECQVSAVNEYGVQSDSESLPAQTPPPINTSPTVLRVEDTNGGVLVYFDPSSYWGSLWFGIVDYRATCDPGSSVTDLSASSAAVRSSPAFIEGLSADDNLSCYVTIDNLYESVAGPVFAYEPEVSSGLPIWLLYEASRQGE